MHPPLHRIPGWKLATVLCLLCRATALHGQSDSGEGTRWLTLKNWSAFTEMDVEAETDSETTGNSRFTSDRLYLAPTLGLKVDGSIYHPNLLQFDLSGQGGYLTQTLNTRTSTGQTSSTTDTSYLQNYAFNAVFLRNQPYVATFTATKTHTLEELDIFNQLIVDAQTYGGRVGYSAGPVPVSLSLQHTDENQSGLFYNNAFTQDNLEFKASNERDGAGSTFFTYNAGQYDQQASSYSEQETYQYGTLTDLEKWGRDNRFTLNSSVFFDQENNTNSPSQNVIVQENLTVKHTPALDSFYTYNFNDDSQGPAVAMTHFMEAGARYQLYESLSSEVDLHGTLADDTAPGSSSTDTIYGIHNSENYTKHLGDWGRLTLGNSAEYDLEDENNSGGVTPVLGEHVTVNDSTYAYLSQPLVISIQQVTDTTGSHIYIEGLDYTTINSGFLTGIRRVLSSPNLTNGAVVLVDYTVQSQPSGSIRTLNDQFQVRLDLFNGLLGIYSGLGWIKNYSSQDFVLDNEFDTLSGVDVTWYWLRTGGSYETHDSNLIEYNTLSLYQTALFRPAENSTISLDTREQWSTYPVEHLQSTDYIATTRFSQRLTPDLSFSAEAGIRNDQGGFLNQTLFAARTDIHYKIGKIYLSLDYQFNDQASPGQALVRNFVSFRLKRSF
jgi:hypothetical protein